jgi:hypothetical protein
MNHCFWTIKIERPTNAPSLWQAETFVIGRQPNNLLGGRTSGDQDEVLLDCGRSSVTVCSKWLA